MPHRKLAYIVKDQEPLALSAQETVQRACQCMKQRCAGSVPIALLSSLTALSTAPRCPHRFLRVDF
jgi:hypothetical protein